MELFSEGLPSGIEILSSGIDVFSIGRDILSFGRDNFTGLCILATALITFKSAARFDRMSYKKEMLDAIKVEILLYTKNSVKFDPERLLAKFYENLKLNDEHTVILPSEVNNSVYNSMVQHIHALPKDAIPAVVQFYSTMNSVEIVVNLINKPGFKDIEVDQKMEMYGQYLSLKSSTMRFANEAVKEIDRIKCDL